MRKRRDEQKIYKTALKLYAKYGYKKTTLEDIANKLDMTSANIYSYASSKQALYHDSVGYALTMWQDKVIKSIDGIDDPVQRLITLCDSAVYYLNEDKVFCQILCQDPAIFPMFPTVDPYEEINQKSLALLKDCLKRGKDAEMFIDVDTDKCAYLLFDLYKALIIETYIRNNRENTLENYQETKKIFLYGILKK